MGYFGYGCYEANEGELKALAIDSGKEPVLPSRETVKSSEYQLLSCPLFIYVNAKAAQTKPEVQDFVQFDLTSAARWTDSEGYVPLPDEAYQTAATHFENGKVGTVFGGRSQLNLTIAELLRKEARFSSVSRQQPYGSSIKVNHEIDYVRLQEKLPPFSDGGGVYPHSWRWQSRRH